MRRYFQCLAVIASAALLVAGCANRSQFEPLTIKVIDSAGNPPTQASTILQATVGYPPNEQLLSAVMGWIDKDGIAVMHNIKQGGPIPSDTFVHSPTVFVVNSDRPNATLVRLPPILAETTPVVTLRDTPFTNRPDLRLAAMEVAGTLVVTLGNNLDDDYVLHESDLSVTIGTTARGFSPDRDFIGTIIPAKSRGQDVVVKLSWRDYVTNGIWVRRHEEIDEPLPGPPPSNGFVYATIKVGINTSGAIMLPSPDRILKKAEESQHGPPGDAR